MNYKNLLRKSPLVFALLLFSVVSFSQPGKVTQLSSSANQVGLYEKWELSFTLDKAYANPYDPNIVSVDAEIMTPSGASLVQPCFYMIPGSFSGTRNNVNTVNLVNSGASWKLRLAPKEIGNYQVKLILTDADGSTESSMVSFVAVSSGKTGFVSVHPQNKQFNQFDNGDPYYPAGFNVCWSDGQDLLHTYNHYLPQMSDGGSNWFRYWMTDFARQTLIWSSDHWSGWYKGLEIYSQRAALTLDSIVGVCEQTDMYFQLVINDHGQFSSSANARWSNNPYNTSKGGMCNSPLEFFTKTESKEMQKRLYRYIVARWGYTPHIFAWEFFNEVQFTDASSNPQAIDAWHDEMSTYVKSIDAHGHLTTTSWEFPDMASLDDNADLDNVQYHLYSNPIVEPLISKTRSLLPSFTNKQLFCGEYGVNTSNDAYVNHPDDDGDHIRKTTWSSVMKQTPAFFWYWNFYMDDKNLYDLFLPLQSYLEDEDLGALPGLDETSLTVINAPENTGPSLEYTPGISWTLDPPISTSFTIDPLGDISPAVTEMQSFLHGNWNPQRGRELEFTGTWIESGQAIAVANAVSSSGAKGFEVSVDGQVVSTQTLFGGSSVSVNVPAGTHTVKFRNTGDDWVQVGFYQFGGIVKDGALKVHAMQNDDHAYGYMYDKRFGQWSTSAELVENASVQVGGLEDGSYELTYYYPFETGSTLPDLVQVTGGQIDLDLPTFRKDLAFKLKKRNVLLTSDISSELELMEIYPNPVVQEVRITSEVIPDLLEVMDAQGRLLKIEKGVRQVFVGDLTPGSYLVRVTSTQGTQTLPFVISH